MSNYPKYCIEYYLEQGRGSDIIIGKETELGKWTLINDLEPGDVISVELTNEDKRVLKLQELRATIEYCPKSSHINKCKYPWFSAAWFNNNHAWQYVAGLSRNVYVIKSSDVIRNKNA